MILSIRTLLISGATFLLPFQAVPAQSDEADASPPATPAAEAEAETDPAPEETQPTVIDSDKVEMVTLEHETRFVFSNNVRITGNNMVILCDQLEVYAAREGEKKKKDDAVAELGRIQRIFAIGNVRIQQEGREAASGRAEVFPQEGRIVLTESPVIRDEQGSVSGERIILYQGESRAVVEGSSTQTARIVLPPMPDLGIGDEESPSEDERNVD